MIALVLSCMLICSIILLIPIGMMYQKTLYGLNIEMYLRVLLKQDCVTITTAAKTYTNNLTGAQIIQVMENTIGKSSAWDTYCNNKNVSAESVDFGLQFDTVIDENTKITL